jgi:ketosteroid isomerase-like protein
MKLPGRIFVAWFVLTFSLNFCAYGENASNGIVNGAVESKDLTVNKIVAIYQQQLQNKDKTKIVADTLKEILDNSIVWKYDGVAGVVPFAGTFSKRAGVEAFWKKYFAAVIPQKMDLRYYAHQGNVLHLHWTEQGVVKSTKKKYVVDNVHCWELNDKGALIKFRAYTDTFAMFEAFQLRTDKQWSLAQHTEDYNVNGDGPVDTQMAKSVIEGIYNNFMKGDMPSIMNVIGPNNVLIFAGPQSIDPVAMVTYGPAGMQTWFNALFSNTEYIGFKVFAYTAEGPRVDIEFEETFYAVKTGKIVTMQGLHSWVVNSDGKTAKIRSYNNTYDITWVYYPQNIPTDSVPK